MSVLKGVYKATMVLIGVLLVVIGLFSGRISSCPAAGCLPLTFGRWLTYFWLNLVLVIVGLALMVGGMMSVLRNRV